MWKFVTDAMVATFRGESGRCNALARGAVRLGFHDAGAWNKTMTYGGADGSLILTNEVSLDANRGLEEIVNQMREWYVASSLLISPLLYMFLFSTFSKAVLTSGKSSHSSIPFPYGGPCHKSRRLT